MKHQNSVLPLKVKGAVLSAFQKVIYNFFGMLTDELFWLRQNTHPYFGES